MLGYASLHPPSPTYGDHGNLDGERHQRTFIAAMHKRPITVAETSLFIRQAADIWSDEERTEFINFLALNPEMGDLMPHSGGIRKLRWSRRGAGKRGGVRVIYFYHDVGMPIYLLTIYAKAMRDNLSPEASRAVQSLVIRLKRAYGR